MQWQRIYFSSVDKLPKLPDPTGSLSMQLLSFSIVLANAGMKSVQKGSVGEGKWPGLLHQAVTQCR